MQIILDEFAIRESIGAIDEQILEKKKMTRAEAINIIRGEELGKYIFFEARNNIENELVILQDEVNWAVYATDERASKITGSEKPSIMNLTH